MAALVAFAMCVFSLIYHPVEIFPIRYGLCLPSPDAWISNSFWSWFVNLLILGGIAVLLWLLNKSYNFIRTTEPVLPALFLVMSASCPWFTESLNTGVLLCLANVLAAGIIFTSYDSKNATQQMFILGVVSGLGSMFQYAFLPMAVVYLLWALFMKVFRLKETLALIAGILCPYWIVLGTGWMNFSDITFPSLTPLFGNTPDHSDFLFLLLGIGLATGLGFIVTMINFMKLYAGNSKVNAMNLCMTTLGAASVICILVDFDNMPAYVITLYMTCAIQLANICALWNPKMPWLVTFLPSFTYVGLFVLNLILG